MYTLTIIFLKKWLILAIESSKCILTSHLKTGVLNLMGVLIIGKHSLQILSSLKIFWGHCRLFAYGVSNCSVLR